jgi:membrane protein
MIRQGVEVILRSSRLSTLVLGLLQVHGLGFLRSFLRGRAIDLLGMVVVLFFGLMSAAMTIFLQFEWLDDQRWILGPEGSVLARILQYLLPLALSFVAFTLMYRVVPEVRLAWSVLWIPGLIAAIGFEVARVGMAIFLSYFGRFQQLYGALSVTVVTLMFVFLVANIVLLAAALACEISRNRDSRENRSIRHAD